MPRRPSSAIVLCAAVAALAVGCSRSSTGPEAQLAVARTQWVAHAPEAYSMVVTTSCECLPGSSGSVLVTVRGGVVESRTYVGSGAPVPAENAASFPAVHEMFAMIDDAVRQGVKPFEVRYAPMGYPTRLAIGDPATDSPLYVITDFRSL